MLLYSISGPAYFAKTALRVELACPGVGVVGVQANRVARPSLRSRPRLRQEVAANAASLKVGRDSHVPQIDGTRNYRKVLQVDGPRFLGVEAERTDNNASASGNQHSGLFDVS